MQKPIEFANKTITLPPNEALSPLADPVVNAVFTDVDSAGLAAESLIHAVMESDGDAKPIDKIIRVTPQRMYPSVLSRGCRVDVETVTQSNIFILFEFQINPDASIIKRNLFMASRIFNDTPNKGDSPKVMTEKLPRVIFIDILGYNTRDDNTDMVQPFKIMYTKPPIKTAVDNFGGYSVQLKRLPELPCDFTNSLYCWSYILYTADKKNISLQEVLEMTPELQEYVKTDIGLQQFCTQYQRAANDPDVRKEYFLWYNELMREEGIIEAAKINADKFAKEKYESIIKSIINEKDAAISDKDAIISDKDAIISDYEAENKELRRMLGMIK